MFTHCTKDDTQALVGQFLQAAEELQIDELQKGKVRCFGRTDLVEIGTLNFK